MQFFFFFNDTATTEIYTLSLHDALPISLVERYALIGLIAAVAIAALGLLAAAAWGAPFAAVATLWAVLGGIGGDRKSTRLNSSHANISYAVFCLKKKKKSWSEHI